MKTNLEIAKEKLYGIFESLFYEKMSEDEFNFRSDVAEEQMEFAVEDFGIKYLDAFGVWFSFWQDNDLRDICLESIHTPAPEYPA